MGVADTKIYPINTGWLEADLGTYIFWKGPAGKKYWNPVYCHYVDTGEHKILIDTGLCDEERASKYHHKCEKRGCLEVHDHLQQKLGVHPDEIDAIVFTHLHWDHVQNMKQFKNARYIAPKAEIEWPTIRCRSTTALMNAASWESSRPIQAAFLKRSRTSAKCFRASQCSTRRGILSATWR